MIGYEWDRGRDYVRYQGIKQQNLNIHIKIKF